MTDVSLDNYWQSYVDYFDYLSLDSIRPGNHPQAMIHDQQVENSIVLLHGLSDSPYYLKALGEFFYSELGYNVDLPLLQGHGLCDPQGLENVQLGEWQRNVSFAIDAAYATGSKVSIGGFSTGGTLCYQMAVHKSPALCIFSLRHSICQTETQFFAVT